MAAAKPPRTAGPGSAEELPVTVLLTLKDRLGLTRRWLEYMRRVEWRIPVHIADGSVEQDASAVVAEFQQQNPSIPITYHRHPPDKGIKVFVAKVIHALEAINTRWVMLTDNDDFMVEEGIHRALEVLQADPALVGCRGRTVYFNQSGGPFGLFEYERKWNARSPRAAERLLNHASSYAPTWYCITDRQLLLEAWRGMHEFPSDDVGFLELYQTTLLVASGPVAWEDFPHLLRQLDGDKTSTRTRRKADQLARIMQDAEWSRTSRMIIDRVAARVHQRDGGQYDDAYRAAAEACRRIVEAALVRQGVLHALGRKGGMGWMATTLLHRYWLRYIASPAVRTVTWAAGPRALGHGFAPARDLLQKDWSAQ
ncbi:MAG: TIGR00180 family glycosyltransferase [Phycisphaerales bacterium]